MAAAMMVALLNPVLTIFPLLLESVAQIIKNPASEEAGYKNLRRVCKCCNPGLQTRGFAIGKGQL